MGKTEGFKCTCVDAAGVSGLVEGAVYTVFEVEVMSEHERYLVCGEENRPVWYYSYRFRRVDDDIPGDLSLIFTEKGWKIDRDAQSSGKFNSIIDFIKNDLEGYSGIMNDGIVEVTFTSKLKKEEASPEEQPHQPHQLNHQVTSEERLIQKTADLWNGYIEMDPVNDSEFAEVASAIHKIQGWLAIRLMSKGIFSNSFFKPDCQELINEEDF